MEILLSFIIYKLSLHEMGATMALLPVTLLANVFHKILFL